MGDEDTLVIPFDGSLCPRIASVYFDAEALISS